jgi:phosphatidylinositol-3-phosphatase
MRRSLAALAVLLLAAACSSTHSSERGPNSTTPFPTAATSAAPTPVRLGHAFVINLENENYDATWGVGSKALYLNGTLRPMGQLLTQYYGIGHASLDNYIAQISGQAPNPDTQADCVNYVEFQSTGVGPYGQALGKGCVYPASVKTIADQLDAAGKTWKGYMQDIGNSATQPKTCRHPKIGETDTTVIPTATDMYATRHDPFVYFHSIIDSPQCAPRVVGLDALATDLRSAATTPNLAYITPDVCDDGHDSPCKDGRPGGLVSADRFLQTWVPKILASPAYQADGVLVITHDEAGSDASACCNTPASPNSDKPGGSGPGGGLVGALVISAKTKPGTTNDTPYNHYSLLCSLEDLWGLDHLGFAGAPGLNCFGKDVYDRSPSG